MSSTKKTKVQLNFFGNVARMKAWICGAEFKEEWTFVSKKGFNEASEPEQRYISFINAFGKAMNPQLYTKREAQKIAQSFWKKHKMDAKFINEFISNPRDLSRQVPFAPKVKPQGGFFKTLAVSTPGIAFLIHLYESMCWLHS